MSIYLQEEISKESPPAFFYWAEHGRILSNTQGSHLQITHKFSASSASSFIDRQLINVSQKLTYDVSKKRLIGIILIVYGGLLITLGFDFSGIDAVYRYVTGGFILAIGLILFYASTKQRHRPFKRL